MGDFEYMGKYHWMIMVMRFPELPRKGTTGVSDSVSFNRNGCICTGVVLQLIMRIISQKKVSHLPNSLDSMVRRLDACDFERGVIDGNFGEEGSMLS